MASIGVEDGAFAGQFGLAIPGNRRGLVLLGVRRVFFAGKDVVGADVNHARPDRGGRLGD